MRAGRAAARSGPVSRRMGAPVRASVVMTHPLPRPASAGRVPAGPVARLDATRADPGVARRRPLPGVVRRTSRTRRRPPRTEVRDGRRRSAGGGACCYPTPCGREQVLPAHREALRSADIVPRAELGQVAIQGLDPLKVVAESAVRRDRRPVLLLEEVAERVGMVEAGHPQQPGLLDDVLHATAEQ